MENKYLEKIAEYSEDDLNYAVGKHLGARKYLTGGFGINSRLKERGYNSNIGKITETFKRSEGSFKDKATNVTKRVLLPGTVGGVLGHAVGNLAYRHSAAGKLGVDVVKNLYSTGGLLAGAYAGILGGTVVDARDSFNRRIPVQLRKEMQSGHYSKVKK